MQWAELPLIINETSKGKYNSISLYHPTPNQPQLYRSRHKQKKKKSHPFLFLSKIPLQTSTKTPFHLRSLNQSIINLENSLDLSRAQGGQFKSLPPLAPAQPKGLTILAFESLANCLATYAETGREQFQGEMEYLQQLKEGNYSQIATKLKKLKKGGAIMLDPLVKVLLHSLQAQSNLKEQLWQSALLNFRKAQFYARKLNQLLFATYCLLEQSDLHRSDSNLQQGLQCLKSALSMSTHIDYPQLHLEILEKIGLLYYYSGNSTMGEHYHRLADKGLTPKELELHRKEYNHQVQLARMEQELFGPHQMARIDDIREDEEASSEAQQEQAENQRSGHLQMVKKMLKRSEEKQMGLVLSKHMRNTLSLATIIPHAISPPKETNNSEQLPFLNTSQVLKSHLSRNRGGIRGGREWHWAKIIDLMSVSLPSI